MRGKVCPPDRVPGRAGFPGQEDQTVNTDIHNLLGRARPHDRQRMKKLIERLGSPERDMEPSRVTISRVGGGGDETQVARWSGAELLALQTVPTSSAPPCCASGSRPGWRRPTPS